MKTKKHLFFILLFLFIAGLSSATAAEKSDNKKNRNVGHFNAISASSGIDLFLSMGQRKSVRVEADDDVLDEIITEVRGSTLHVYRKNNSWFNIFNWGKSRSVKVYVTAPVLEEISASSGSDVRSETSLKGDRLEVNSSSGSDVVLDVVYKDVSFDASSGADIRMSGKAKTVKASASSGSDINARELKASICHAHASSGADVVVFATEEIHAGASSGGDVSYYGNPSVKNIEESSGGDVSAR